MDVQIRCICPLKGDEVRHPNGDTVTLRDRLDWRTVQTMRKSMTTVDTEDDKVRLAEKLAVLTDFYILMGITSWSLVDEKGKPVPVSHSAIRERLLELDDDRADGPRLEVSEAAEKAYNPVVLVPLVLRATGEETAETKQDSPSSPPTPTPSPELGLLTSPVSDSEKKPMPTTPSKPSSITTSPTVAIETITSSPSGGSKSSRRSQSAA